MNIPLIIYIAHEIHSEHTVRRRGRFIAPVFTKYQFCECLSSFYGCLHICGHDKSTLQLLTDCDNACEHSANYLRSPTKYTTNTPLNAENRFIVPVYFCCHFIYCSKLNRRNQKQATLKITNKEKELSLHTVCRKDTL